MMEIRHIQKDLEYINIPASVTKIGIGLLWA